MRVAILSDTHLPRGRRALPAPCRQVLARADVVVHAGDLSERSLLTELRAFGAPVVAVRGNADEPALQRELPQTAAVELRGLRLAVVHDGGPAAGRLERLRKRFPDAGAVAFGHSHIPLHETAADGFFILNPGSATDRRRQPRHSMVELVVPENGGAPDVRFLAVDEPEGPLDPALVRR